MNVAGVKRSFDAQITEQHPEERVAWKSVDGITHAGVVTFHKLSDATTRVTVQLDWEPDGALEKAASAVNADDHQVANDLDRFKKFIEARGTRPAHGAATSRARTDRERPTCGFGSARHLSQRSSGRRGGRRRAGPPRRGFPNGISRRADSTPRATNRRGP